MMKTSPKNRVLIVADAHLPLDGRQGGRQEREAMLEMLRSYESSLGCVVLLGDFFDFWYEWKHVVPKRAWSLLNHLRSLVDKGVPVHYFAGNHDFRLRGFLEQEIGLEIHMDEWVTEIDGKRWLFHHGDGEARSDVNYRRMKRVFRSRWAQTLFGFAIHPDLAMGLGRVTSDGGRQKHEQRGENIWPPLTEYLAAAQRRVDAGHDVVVYGHTHLSSDVELNGGLFHNPGPWYRDRYYSVVEGGPPKREVWT
jgi:UDP-2,3-diacylglucosamine hydrolase